LNLEITDKDPIANTSLRFTRNEAGESHFLVLNPGDGNPRGGSELDFNLGNSFPGAPCDRELLNEAKSMRFMLSNGRGDEGAEIGIYAQFGDGTMGSLDQNDLC